MRTRALILGVLAGATLIVGASRAWADDDDRGGWGFNFSLGPGFVAPPPVYYPPPPAYYPPPPRWYAPPPPRYYYPPPRYYAPRYGDHDDEDVDD